MRLAIVLALCVAGGLSGCVSSTVLVNNDKASDVVKAKSFSAYHEVLLMPPKEDPRNVVPRVAHDLEAMGFQVLLLDPSKPLEAAQGTGFVVGRDGWLLTCAHVVGEQKEATVTLDGQRYIADVRKADSKADLALLKLRDPLPAGMAPLALRRSKAAAMGEDVYTIGYPLSRMLGNKARMTKGLLSATSGLHDDEKEVQVSAEIQPGNSGGPLLDRDGSVIGIVNRTISPAAVAQSTGGALPQNVNFAIKVSPVVDFIKDAEPQAYQSLAFDAGAGLEGSARAVAKIQAGVVGPDSERNDKMIVRLSYISMWDVWYRFRAFVLAAYDYETLEPLFAAGQGHDNLVSNEDVVIRDTMGQFRRAIATR